MRRRREFSAALIALVVLAPACGGSSEEGDPATGTSPGETITTQPGATPGAPDRVDLVLSGEVQAKIRTDDRGGDTRQDVFCFPPDAELAALTCDFSGLYESGVASNSIMVDAYHGPGTYTVGDGLDVSLVEGNVLCIGKGGSVTVRELESDSTSEELDAQLEFDAELGCRTPTGSGDASLTGEVDAHPDT